MVAILKVRDKEDNLVLLRHGVDAHEIIASDPERFEILDQDDDADHDEDVMGNPVSAEAKKIHRDRAVAQAKEDGLAPPAPKKPRKTATE